MVFVCGCVILGPVIENNFGPPKHCGNDNIKMFSGTPVSARSLELSYYPSTPGGAPVCEQFNRG